MSDDSQDGAKAPALGGISGVHPSADPLEYLVAPSTSGEFNTVHLRLIPIACWRVDDVRFRFDSSFPLFDSSSDANNPNDIRAEFKALSDLVKAHPGSPLSVFGHADPVGNDDYNKTLSGRRATAIYAILIRDTSLWDNLFNKPFGGDNWHTDVLETMQKATGLPKGTQNSILFKSYMDLLCGAGFQLQKSDFLAQGADAGGKGDYQGCGEFNPVLLFSKEKQSAFDHAAQKSDKVGIQKRNAANSPNRRVLVLMFRKGSKVDPSKWPCPRATEGVGGCKKRFFADGERRRTTHSSGADRTFEESEDTFACRFYQRISSGSPCHAIVDNAVVTQIIATVGGTPGKRDATNKRPDKSFTSGSDQEGLDANKPAILIRGCRAVELRAVTTPPNMPVSWLVKPNENNESAPTITPTEGGRKATLKTNKAGSFSVVALSGVSKIIWNVVFVWVKLVSSNIESQDSEFKDNHSGGGATGFRSGRFKKGEYAWEAKVKVSVIGGGTDHSRGVSKTKIHILQNGVEDTLEGNYKDGGTAREVPKGGVPVVDATDDDALPPYVDNPDAGTVKPDNSSLTDANTDREVWTGDSPGGGFPSAHQNTNKPLQTITGVNRFKTAIASTSDDAPDAIVVHAMAGWIADFKGKVAPSGEYTADGAHVKKEDLSFALVSEDTGGQDAFDAGFETFKPIFRAVETQWNP
jgi:hypothetical protein